MNEDKPSASGSVFDLLDVLTATLLGLVLGALAWMVLVAQLPSWCRLFSEEHEVVLVVALLSATLVLVSVVALKHTRS